MAESVNHPAHYGGDTVYETIKVLEAWLTPEQFIGFCRGNAIKYQSRAGKKGDVGEDLAKARFYTDYEREYRARTTTGAQASQTNRVACTVCAEDVHRRLKSLVAARGITLERASVLAGLERSYLRKLFDRETALPGAAALTQLAGAFHCSASYILHGEVPEVG